MTIATANPLTRQFDLACKLAHHHLDGLGDEECLWRPAAAGPHVRRGADGQWHADWPEREDYGAGPASIAWLTWHMVFWWSMALDHSFGPGDLTRERVFWPGSAGAVRDRLGALEQDWRRRLDALTEEDYRSAELTRWPFADRPFADLVAWVNLELIKNGAEIGYGRFLFASRGAGA